MDDNYRASVRQVQKLIRDVQKRELESARSLVFEELRTLRIDPHLIDFILRRVSEQTSKEGLIEQLKTFADSLGSQESPLRERIPADREGNSKN